MYTILISLEDKGIKISKHKIPRIKRLVLLLIRNWLNKRKQLVVLKENPHE